MVCVDYSDFLKITLPYNKHNFDNIIVVTSPTDIKTQKVCKDNGVKCIQTNRMYQRKAKFNKGKALNDGIRALDRKDWVLITDADMIMPKNLRNVLEKMELNINNVYGTGRMICPDKEQWLAYLKDESICNGWRRETRRVNIGVGFFQLINANSELLLGKDIWYSERYNHCGRSDRKFWRAYPPENRFSIQHIITTHLGDDHMGANWEGRRTPEWD